MEYKDTVPILDDLHKELLEKSPGITTIVLVADHTSGDARYYISGFPEVQASLIRMLLSKDRRLAIEFYIGFLPAEKGQ